MGRPPRGGAGSARPLAESCLYRGIAPLGHRAFDCPFMITSCLGLRTASQCGRGDRIRPRKTPFALSPGFPPKASHPGLPPAEGRAPHARNADITPTQMLSLFGHEPLARPSVIMKCPGLRPALPRGRTQCVPPRKPPLALSPGFPPKASHPGLPPAEGRAPHARIGRHRLDRGMCAVGQPASCLIIGWKWNASARVRPCHADAQSASLRENRPQRHPRALHREAILGRMADSAEGRAPHAREERTGLTETCALLATGLSSTHPVGMECPGLRPALRHGRTECVPPRRRPSASSPGLHPLGKPRWGRPRRGGAGSARP